MHSGISRSGFTLIEVSFAVLVIGLGLLSVFALFPTGVRFSEDSIADTRAGLFAETVFNKMRSNADTLTTWDSWTSTFSTKVMEGYSQSGPPIVFPDSSVDYLRYRLTLDSSNPTRYSATLSVCDGQYGPFTAQSTFYTEFTFKGL